MKRMPHMFRTFLLMALCVAFSNAGSVLAQEVQMPDFESLTNAQQQESQGEQGGTIPPIPEPNINPETNAPVASPATEVDSVKSPSELRDERFAEIVAKTTPQEIGVEPSEIESLFFVFQEYAAILMAKRTAAQGEDVRGVTQDDIERALRNGGEQPDRPKPPPEEREIALSGIVYEGEDDWVIWLNNQRVEPNAIPKEIIGLVVHKEYIEMKWLDDYTMQIYPIRLRPHQRFNLDTRMFLPG